MDDEERNRQAWARLHREQQARALRFGPRPEKERDKRRKLEPYVYGSISLAPPQELEAYLERFLPVFGRRDTLRQAELYVLGLLSGLDRKNGETMEAGVPGATQQGVWDFLVRSPWSAEALDRARVLDALQRAGCAGRPLDIVIDEVGWRKKGSHSVGVARQYLGCIGKVDNGQVAVSLHGCCEDFDLPLLGELYLTEKWAADKDRRAAAKIPEAMPFRTKPELALELLRRLSAWGLELGRIHGDAGYGDLAMLQALHADGLEFCLGVRSNARVRLPGEEWIPAVPAPPYSGHGRPREGEPARPRLHPISELHQVIPVSLWCPVVYRQGVGGEPLTREFVALRAHVVSAEANAESEELWLLLERPVTQPGTKDDLKQYVLSGPEALSLDELAQLAHRRPIIERNSYENSKQQVGLADYQGRSWGGFHHHLAMVWIALTWLMLQRRPLPPPAAPSGDQPMMRAPQSAAPASSPAQPPTLPFSSGCVPVAVAIPAPPLGPLPRQLWESVQEVHRRLCEWFAGMRFREILLTVLGAQPVAELLLVGVFPPLPALGPLPSGP